MATWFVKRCLWAMLLALAVATSIIAIVNLLPGDPITLILGEASTHAYYDTAQILRQQLGLDLPLHQRYVRWLSQPHAGGHGYLVVHQHPRWPWRSRESCHVRWN